MRSPFLLHERSLFVVEQQGKSARLAQLLSQTGFTRFRVQPTYGTLFDLPRHLIGIHPISLRATGYEVQRRPVASRLQELANDASCIFVMTDADREGELIAAQVQQLCPGRPLVRLRLRALTPAALDEALRGAGRIDAGAAAASAARRIVDRIIGYGFSNPCLPRRTGIVGRVLTAALAAFDRGPVPCGEWSGRLTGGLEAHGTVTNRSLRDAERIEVLLRHAGHELERLPRERVRKRVAPPPACTGADAILEGRRRLGIPTGTGERLLQVRYQEGALSYVRSDSAHVGREARALAINMARASKLVTVQDMDDVHGLVPPPLNRKHAHEALHPTFPVNLDLDPSYQDSSDALLTLVARRLAMAMAAPADVECEQVVPRELHRFLVDRLGDAAAGVEFHLVRDLSPQTTWMRWLKRADNPSLPRVERYGADATALAFLAGANFGRPSTHIHFVDALLEHGFLDDCGNVSPLGQKALDYAREHAPFLLDHSRIAAVEELLDRNDRSSVPDLVVKLCETIGLPRKLAQTVVSNWYLSRRLHPAGTASALPGRSFPPTFLSSFS